MEIQIESARNTDINGIERVLAAAKLPVDGVRERLDSTIVARLDAQVIGCAGLETYSSGVLLRSVAVDSQWRGQGLGERLTEVALTLARRREAKRAFLLTTNAAAFFTRFGFIPINRVEVPDDVKRSPQFTGEACSAAITMRADL